MRYSMFIVCLTVLLVAFLGGCTKPLLLPASDATISIEGVEYKIELYSEQIDTTKGDGRDLYDTRFNTVFQLTVTNNSAERINVNTAVAKLIDNLGENYDVSKPYLPSLTEIAAPRATYYWSDAYSPEARTIVIGKNGTSSITTSVYVNSNAGRRSSNINAIILDMMIRIDKLKFQKQFIEPGKSVSGIICFSKFDKETSHVTLHLPIVNKDNRQVDLAWEFDVKPIEY